MLEDPPHPGPADRKLATEEEQRAEALALLREIKRHAERGAQEQTALVVLVKKLEEAPLGRVLREEGPLSRKEGLIRDELTPSEESCWQLVERAVRSPRVARATNLALLALNGGLSLFTAWVASQLAQLSGP